MSEKDEFIWERIIPDIWKEQTEEAKFRGIPLFDSEKDGEKFAALGKLQEVMFTQSVIIPGLGTTSLVFNPNAIISFTGGSVYDISHEQPRLLEADVLKNRIEMEVFIESPGKIDKPVCVRVHNPDNKITFRSVVEEEKDEKGYYGFARDWEPDNVAAGEEQTAAPLVVPFTGDYVCHLLFNFSGGYIVDTE